MPTPHLVALFLAQVAVVLMATTLCGKLMAMLRQPRVIGEILGGLLLGPLVLGHLFPHIAAILFPPDHIHGMEVVSNFGLVLFLFYVGMEFDLKGFKSNPASTVAITLGSIIVPLILGASVASPLAERFPSTNARGIGFVLFSGVAFSITAFPVLARILQDRKDSNRPVDPEIAATTLIAAAANDLLGWSLMAIALVLLPDGAHKNLNETFLRLLLLFAYVALMLLAVRPLLAHVRSRFHQIPEPVWIVTLLLIAFASSSITDFLGVHAFFGAFLAGVCVPADSDGSKRLENSLSKLLLPVTRYTLPLFFAMTGLRMQSQMFSFAESLWLALVLLIAVTGKIGGTALVGRLSGLSWPTSTRIGILMNTRGLVELIVLNVGFREHVLSSELFTLLVLMALLTTAMTTPLLDLFSKRRSVTDDMVIR
jgi:Kef-type K+ transport system membrane component KefB